MHKGYARRTGPIWVVVAIMTVVMVIIARAGFKSFQSAEDLYKANEVYYVNDKGSSVAIKVMDIDPEPLVLNGHTYYLVKHERGVAVFEAKSDELNNVLEAKKAAGNAENALEASNLYLSVRVTPEKSKGKRSNEKVNVTPEMKDAFYKKYKESPLYSEKAKTQIDESRILKLTTSETQWGDSAMTFVMLAIVLGLIAFQIYQTRRLKAQYTRFDAYFPEYANNMKQLLDDAEYVDSKLKILVMEGILVSYDINFTVVDLSEVSKSYLVFENRRKGGMRVHLRFEYPNKKYDSILFRRQLLRLKDLVEYLNEEYNLGLKVDFRLLG